MAELWCMHVIGPDDVHAAPDKETAQNWADWLNAEAAKSAAMIGEDDPMVKATVAPWPYSAESHADDLPRAVAIFALVKARTDA